MNRSQQGQSFLDIVTQQTGAIENVVLMALKNNVSITGAIAIGSTYATAGVLKNNVLTALYRKSKPATAISNLDFIINEDLGIGAMTIGSTFKVR